MSYTTSMNSLLAGTVAVMLLLIALAPKTAHGQATTGKIIKYLYLVSLVARTVCMTLYYKMNFLVFYMEEF